MHNFHIHCTMYNEFKANQKKICKLQISSPLKGSLTIRPFSSPRLKNMLVNCSTFAFLLNFSFMKYRKHHSFGFWGNICLTNINSRDFYIYKGISLWEYIEVSIFSYTMLFPPWYTTSFWYIIHYHVLRVPCNGNCVSQGGGTVSYKKKIKSLYNLSKKCPDGQKNLDYWYLLCKYGPDTLNFDGFFTS